MLSSRRPQMGNHNRCWIWGRNVVLETLRAGYWPIHELLLSDQIDPNTATDVRRLAHRTGIPVSIVDDAMIRRQCRAEEHQGFAARMSPFPYRELDQVVASLPEKPVLVMLDRVQDSFNFGAIVRSIDVLGMDGVIVGQREQAPVNSQVARSSAGAVNSVPIAQVAELTAAAESLAQQGFQIVGTSDHASESILNVDFCRPSVLIIGNEGRGIQPELQSRCSRFVQIPVQGTVNSLNAAVSAGILCYEVLRQRLTREDLRSSQD